MTRATDDDFDPWETSIHGIKPMSPEEIAFWDRFDDYMTSHYGYSWSIEIPTPPPTPAQRQAAERMSALGRACAQQMTDLAIEVLTDG